MPEGYEIASRKLVLALSILGVVLLASFFASTINTAYLTRGSLRVANVEEVSTIFGIGSDAATASSASTATPSQTTTVSAQTVPLVEVEGEAPMEIPDYVNEVSVTRYVKMNMSPALWQNGNTILTIPFSGGSKTIPLEMEEIEYDTQNPTEFSWTGHVVGDELSSATIVYKNGLFAGNIVTATPNAEGVVRNYSIMPFEGGKVIVTESDPDKYPFLIDFVNPSEAQTQLPGVNEVEGGVVSVEGETNFPFVETAVADDTILFAGSPTAIDVMVVYTKNAMDVYGYTPDYIDTVIASWAAQMNQALKKSKTNTKIKIVHAYLTPTYQEGSDLTETLDDFMDGGKGIGKMKEVQAKRDYYGADISVIIAESYSIFPGKCGVANLVGPSIMSLSNMSSKMFAALDTHPFCSDPAFIAMAFAHEIGHNFGFKHDFDNSHGYVGAYPDSFGYQFDGSQGYGTEDFFRTIMSYECSTLNCPPIMYYSNPDVVVNNLPVGSDSKENGDALKRQAGLPFPVQTWAEKIASVKPTSTNQLGPPLAPQNVVASDGTDYTNVYIGWEVSSNTDTYEVFRKTHSGSNWNKIGSTDKWYYTDTTPQDGVVYDYRVRAKNTGGTSPYSNSDSGSVATHGLPPAPTNVQANFFNGGTAISLTWDGDMWLADKYDIFLTPMKDAPGCQDIYATVESYTNYQWISPLNVNVWYTISIRARNAYGNSPCVLATIHPKVVSSVTATNMGDRVRLDWSGYTGPYDYFTVYRSGSFYNFSTATAIGTTSTMQWDDADPANQGVEQYYWVIANYKGVDGSNGIATPGWYMPGVSNFSSQTAPPNTAILSWSSVTNANGYIIYQNPLNQACIGRQFFVSGWATPTFTKTGLPTGKTYYYSILPVGGGNVVGLCSETVPVVIG